MNISEMLVFDVPLGSPDVQRCHTTTSTDASFLLYNYVAYFSVYRNRHWSYSVTLVICHGGQIYGNMVHTGGYVYRLSPCADHASK